MLNRLIILSLIVMFFSIDGKAQQKHYSYLNTWNEFDGSQAQSLFFRFENANFFKNNEYTTPILDGYTLIGLWGRFLFEYYPAYNLRIKLGTHLLKYHGREEIEGVEVFPYYSLQYKPIKDLSIIFGNLDNSRNMDLLAPMYEPELFYTLKPSSGLMLDYNHELIKVKSWINWETHIFESDPFQEKFFSGLNAEFSILNNESLSISIPVQFTYHHQGGEIDSSDNLIQTLMNGASGINITKKVADWTYGVSGYYLGYREATSNSLQEYKVGQGGLARFNLGYKESLLSFGYWHGYKFISPKGQRIYQSISYSNPGQTFAIRKLIEGRFLFNLPIKNSVRLVLEADAFYDINETDLSYAWGIHLIFSESFFIRKLKKSTPDY